MNKRRAPRAPRYCGARGVYLSFPSFFFTWRDLCLALPGVAGNSFSVGCFFMSDSFGRLIDIIVARKKRLIHWARQKPLWCPLPPAMVSRHKADAATPPGRGCRHISNSIKLSCNEVSEAAEYEHYCAARKTGTELRRRFPRALLQFCRLNLLAMYTPAEETLLETKIRRWFASYWGMLFPSPFTT